MKQSVLLFLLVLIAACSSSPKLPPPDRTEQAWVYLMQAWSLDARISIIQPSSDRTDSARLNWEQQQAAYKIQLSAGPFNQTVAILSGRPGYAEIRVAGEEDHYTARSPESLMQALLGWNLPIRHAVWWIRGVPDPAISHTTLIEDSQFRFNQAGWEVDIVRYQDISSIHRLPSRIRMVHNELRVNLVIDRWDIDSLD